MKTTALITGASTGIGKAIAYHHAPLGDLVLVARSMDKLSAIKKDLEHKFATKVIVISKDLTKSNAPEEVHEEIHRLGIKIDYLINNAGLGGQGLFHQRKQSADQQIIDLNVVALVKLCKLFIPDFINQKQGKILNVSSIASLSPGPLQSIYFASKAFITSFSQSIANELKDSGVTVTVVLPGPTHTEFSNAAGMKSAKLFDNAVSAELVAKSSYEAMMKGKVKALSGVSRLHKMIIALMPFLPNKVIGAYVMHLNKI